MATINMLLVSPAYRNSLTDIRNVQLHITISKSVDTRLRALIFLAAPTLMYECDYTSPKLSIDGLHTETS